MAKLWLAFALCAAVCFWVSWAAWALPSCVPVAGGCFMPTGGTERYQQVITSVCGGLAGMMFLSCLLISVTFEMRWKSEVEAYQKHISTLYNDADDEIVAQYRSDHPEIFGWKA